MFARNSSLDLSLGKIEWLRDVESRSLLSREGAKAEIANHQARPRIYKLTTSVMIHLMSALFISGQAFIIALMILRSTPGCKSPNGLSLERTVSRTVYEHSRYLSHNTTEADNVWDSILAGHGIVAISQEYATQRRLPPTIEMPDQSGDLIYIVEAYHAMHCVQILRTHYLALKRNNAWEWSHGHDLHCFDALRQYIMCNVDDTLLWTTGNRKTGEGQQKMCNDWDALRDWTEERTAKYFDSEPEFGIPHMNNYHAGDGLPVGSLSEI